MKKELYYVGNKLSLEYFDNLINSNVWKAFATIHSGVHQQLRIILRYKYNKDKRGKPLGYHKEKWNIILRKTFDNLIKDLFIIGIIEEPLKTKLIHFNLARNKLLGHIDIYERTEVDDKEIEKICILGLEICILLDEIIKKIFNPT